MAVAAIAHFGVNLVLDSNPSYEWYVLGESNASPVDSPMAGQPLGQGGELLDTTVAAHSAFPDLLPSASFTGRDTAFAAMAASGSRGTVSRWMSKRSLGMALS